MSQLTRPDDYGMFIDKKDTARVDSRVVAQMFNKRHDNVMDSIKRIIDPENGVSEEFTDLNFKVSKYKDNTGRSLPCYAMTRDGFTILAMGFTGKKAMRFKEAYIRRFNQMEKFIFTLVSARKDYPLLTENVAMLHENPRPYHFSNEADMLNRIIIGMTAKQFRQLHDIPKGESIRPHLEDEQIWLMDTLQKADIGLMISEPNFEARKRHLEWYKAKLLEKRYCKLAG